MGKVLETVRENGKIASLVSYAIVASMMSCLGIAAMHIMARLIIGRNFSFIPIFAFFTAMFGIFSQRKFRRSSDLEINPWVYRSAEWVVLIVLLKLVIYAWNGFDELISDLSLWRSDFLENFFTAEFLLSLTIVLIIWGITIIFVEDLADLEEDVNNLPDSTLDIIVSNRAEVHHRMTQRVMGIGMGLVIVSTFTRLDYSTLLNGAQLSRQNILYILAYFLLGLMLLSITNLSERRAAWAWGHLPVGGGIGRNWILYSLGFLLVLSLIAFILPTGYTLGFLPSLRYLISLVFSLIYALMLLILLPITLLFSWLINLFGLVESKKPPLSIPRQILPPMPEVIATSSSPFLAILKSIIFWGLLIGAIGYAFWVYARQNKELVKVLHQIPVLAWLFKAWQWLIHKTRVGLRLLPKVVKSRLQRLRSSPDIESVIHEGNYLSLRLLNARQKLLFYYYALLRRASEMGIARQFWQTPQQYAHSLKTNLPELSPDIDALTQGFEEARYSQHSITKEKANHIKLVWDHIRKMIQKYRKFKLSR